MKKPRSVLEEKINLRLAMSKHRSKEQVKEIFTRYVIVYSKIKNPIKNDISDYKNTFLRYLDYMQGSGK